MINILEALDFNKMTHERLMTRLIERTSGFLGVAQADTQNRLDSLRAAALSAHANLDTTGFLVESSIYFLTLLLHFGGWDEETHRGWHDFVETNGMGADCADGQILAQTAFITTAFAADEDDLRMILRLRFIDQHPPDEVAEDSWKLVSENVAFDPETCRHLCVDVAGLMRNVQDWGPWSDTIGGAIGAIEAVAAASPKLAVQMAFETMVYAVNSGVISHYAIGEFWSVLEAHGLVRPDLPSPGTVFGTNEFTADISAAIRAALGNLGQNHGG